MQVFLFLLHLWTFAERLSFKQDKFTGVSRGHREISTILIRMCHHTSAALWQEWKEVWHEMMWELINVGDGEDKGERTADYSLHDRPGYVYFILLQYNHMLVICSPCSIKAKVADFNKLQNIIWNNQTDCNQLGLKYVWLILQMCDCCIFSE